VCSNNYYCLLKKKKKIVLGTRYLSRRIITYCKDSLIITIIAKLPLRMPIIMLGMNFATITNYPF